MKAQMRSVIGLLFSVASSRVAYAHPIHTTLTKVTVQDRVIMFNVRAFADDFSATVARFAGHPAPVDSSVSSAEVLRYAQMYFTLVDGAGKPVVLESCGVKRVKELYWLCFKATFPGGSSGARLRNGMLTELHADQVNIVQLEPPATRRTMFFTKGSAAALIAG